jgi:hypothetical protein
MPPVEARRCSRPPATSHVETAFGVANRKEADDTASGLPYPSGIPVTKPAGETIQRHFRDQMRDEESIGKNYLESTSGL